MCWFGTERHCRQQHCIAEVDLLFKVCLQDVQLVAFTQGGLDGGLDIPHGDKRFVGYDTEAKKLDTEQLKKYILGGHVGPCCPFWTLLCPLVCAAKS